MLRAPKNNSSTNACFLLTLKRSFQAESHSVLSVLAAVQTLSDVRWVGVRRQKRDEAVTTEKFGVFMSELKRALLRAKRCTWNFPRTPTGKKKEHIKRSKSPRERPRCSHAYECVCFCVYACARACRHQRCFVKLCRILCFAFLFVRQENRNIWSRVAVSFMQNKCKQLMATNNYSTATITFQQSELNILRCNKTI